LFVCFFGEGRQEMPSIRAVGIERLFGLAAPAAAVAGENGKWAAVASPPVRFATVQQYLILDAHL
jgi:hypothetical protein